MLHCSLMMDFAGRAAIFGKLKKLLVYNIIL